MWVGTGTSRAVLCPGPGLLLLSPESFAHAASPNN